MVKWGENMSEIYPLYSAQWEGESYDNDEVYQLLIIIKWKSNSKFSLEEGHKAYYVKLNGLKNNPKLNEDQLKEIYENHPEYTRLRIQMEVKVYVEN